MVLVVNRLFSQRQVYDFISKVGQTRWRQGDEDLASLAIIYLFVHDDRGGKSSRGENGPQRYGCSPQGFIRREQSSTLQVSLKHNTVL